MACPAVTRTVVANPVTDSPADDGPELDFLALDAPAPGCPAGRQPVADSPAAVSPEAAPAADRQSAGTLPEAPAVGPVPGPARSGWGAGWPEWPGRPARPGRLPRPPRQPRQARQARSARAVDMDLAAEFIQLHRSEVPSAGPAEPRLREIRREISRTGTYQHTLEELEFGARVAWRNSSRCIGRLYWKSLKVRDRREVSSAADIAAECADHLRAATNHGRVRPVITVFAPDTPARSGPRIWNEQLVRYAGLPAAGRVGAR